MSFPDWLRVVILSAVEGITEWLPVSSTGHLILLDAFWPGNATVFTPEFTAIFDVVIQIGAALAVVTVFFHKLNPVSQYKTADQKKDTLWLWLKIILAEIPAAVVGFFLDDWADAHLNIWPVVAAMLILFGIFFIVAENRIHKKDRTTVRLNKLTIPTAVGIGLFQVLALIPGTSRSGVTVLGALLLGCSRFVACEFSFFLAIPVIFGASGLKLVKYFIIDGMTFSTEQTIVLLVATALTYVVSMLVVNAFVKYIKRHDFKGFGVYRIILGLVVIVLFGLVLK